MESAKQQLLALVASLEIETAEQMAARQAAKVAAIGTRRRDADEAGLRQALLGKALVKLVSESSPSAAGSAYFYSTERFKLCPNGQGLYTYRANSNVSGTGRDDNGDRYETASYHDADGNTLAGSWDIVRSGNGFSLEIHAGRPEPEYWTIVPNGQEGYIIGGKKFWIAGSDSDHGPQCP